MPSANGVYSLPNGYLAVTGAVIEISQHNVPLEDIAAALTGRLSRDGTAPMTGPVQATDGTVGAPSVTFTSAPNTGLYKTASGFGVAVGGSKVAEITGSGLASGVWFPGMVLPWLGSTVPSALWVFCAGQTLSRAAYPSLWTFAQAEIAASNALFNNGDGSTTFGIADLRGRVLTGKDNMGGSAANRITNAGSGITGTTLGASGGAQNETLLTANFRPTRPLARSPTVRSRRYRTTFRPAPEAVQKIYRLAAFRPIPRSTLLRVVSPQHKQHPRSPARPKAARVRRL